LDINVRLAVFADDVFHLPDANAVFARSDTSDV
jgi:hypothetical protein